MQDRPSYGELLEAVRQFIETDVVPALDGTKKFHARVAANVVAIVQRELQSQDAQLTTEWERLNVLLGPDGSRAAERADLRRAIRQRTEDLCERIRRGDADTGNWREQVVGHVRQTVLDKLAVANPRFLGAELSSATALDSEPR